MTDPEIVTVTVFTTLYILAALFGFSFFVKEMQMGLIKATVLAVFWPLTIAFWIILGLLGGGVL